MTSETSAKHMAMRRVPDGVAPSPVAAVALAILLALLLEVGTIIGAPALSLASPASWKPLRVAFFLVASLYPAWKLAGIDWRGLPGRVSAFWTDDEGRNLRRARTDAIILIAAGALGYAFQQVMAAARGVDDPRYAILAAAVASIAALLIANREEHRESPEWGYLAIALISGLAMCALMPAAAQISFDGASHFNTANAMSYVLDAEYTDADRIMTWQGQDVGALAALEMELPPDVLEVDLGAMTGVYPHADLGHGALVRAEEILCEADGAGSILILDGVQRLGGVYVAPRSLGLIPNAAGLWLGRLLGLSAPLRYLLGRVANMLFYVTMMFLAMRRLRSGKLIVAAIGLIPISMLLAANYSYDPWHTSLITYAIARHVGYLQEDRPLEQRDLMGVAIPFVLGVAVKAVVFPLGLVFCLVPARRFASASQARRYRAGALALILVPSLIIAIPVCLLLVLGERGYELVSSVITSDMRGGAGVDALMQMRYVLEHPIEVMRMVGMMMLRMMAPHRAALAITPSDESLTYFFPYLIPSSAPLTEVISAAECSVLLAVALLDRDGHDEGYRSIADKVMPLVAFALSFFNIAMALYISYTDVGRDVIGGVQYRYLVPLIVPILLATLNFGLFRGRAPRFLRPAFFAAEAALAVLVLVNSFAVWF